MNHKNIKEEVVMKTQYKNHKNLIVATRNCPLSIFLLVTFHYLLQFLVR